MDFIDELQQAIDDGIITSLETKDDWYGDACMEVALMIATVPLLGTNPIATQIATGFYLGYELGKSHHD